MPSLNTTQARENLSQLVEQAHYQNKQIQIRRNHRAMAWLVGSPFMDAVSLLVDRIIAYDPTLADTLALELDTDIQQIILNSHQEAETDNLLPLETILDEN